MLIKFRFSPRLIWLLFGVALITLWNCSSSESESSETVAEHSPWLNVYDSVGYVGMSTCAQCHDTIQHTFIHTGMGSSFDSATYSKTAADFTKHPVLYDKFNDFYYQAFKSNGHIYIREFRLEGKDTIHNRVEQADYIVGSGHHTNSHLYAENGYLFQMPMTFYTQQKRWDLPPGFENGNNNRFTRALGAECLTCHNAYSGFDPQSENRYTFMPKGIDCERCHGPGALHVAEKKSGKWLDTKRDTDFTIVNPRKLPFDRQVSLCQRCHLQGNTVLKPGKSFFDFKPGMKLSDVMTVFLPRYEGDNQSFIMASHADRMTQSKCFKVSGKLNCISCHNPHVSVRNTDGSQFNNACKSCHSSKNDCKLPVAKRPGNNCVNCHMPKSGTIDIPHVTVHDHYIRKPEKPKPATSQKRFVGIAAVNDPNPSNITLARAYTQYWERFARTEPVHLDSALYYLNKVKKQDNEFLMAKVHLMFLRNDYKEVIKCAPAVKSSGITDAWTLYRIGEAYHMNDDLNSALEFLKKAVMYAKFNLEFQNKLAAYKLEAGDQNGAKSIYEFILKQNPKYVPALSNLGFIYLSEGNPDAAEILYKKGLALDPDYEQLMLNWAGLQAVLGNKAEAIKQLKKVLKKYPNSVQAKQGLAQLTGN